MNIKDLSTLTIHKMASVEQFNREYAAGNIDDYAMYLVPEEQIDLSNYATIDMLEGLAIESTVDLKLTDHNTATEAHNDIRQEISALSLKVDNLLDVDDTTLAELSDMIELINNNKDTLEDLTTGKVNVSDIIDNLTTAIADQPLSANQGVVLKRLIETLRQDTDTTKVPNTRTVNGKALNANISLNAADVGADAAGSAQNALTDAKEYVNDVVVPTLNTHINQKANTSDIATTATMGISNSTVAYVKISNFGDWGTGPWYAKGFSMLVTARAGETVWVSVSSDDSNTNARAIRLLNTYTKIVALHYSPSESALYVTANAWANNINAHILSNVNGDYVPSVEQVSALPSDAVAISITELGPGYDTTNIGNGVTPLRLTGSETRPMYNNSALAAYSDVQELRADVEQLKGASIAVLSGNGVPSASLGEDGDIYLVMG